MVIFHIKTPLSNKPIVDLFYHCYRLQFSLLFYIYTYKAKSIGGVSESKAC